MSTKKTSPPSHTPRPPWTVHSIDAAILGPSYDAMQDLVHRKPGGDVFPTGDRAALPADAGCAPAPAWIFDIFHRVAKDPSAA